MLETIISQQVSRRHDHRPGRFGGRNTIDSRIVQRPSRKKRGRSLFSRQKPGEPDLSPTAGDGVDTVQTVQIPAGSGLLRRAEAYLQSIEKTVPQEAPPSKNFFEILKDFIKKTKESRAKKDDETTGQPVMVKTPPHRLYPASDSSRRRTVGAAFAQAARMSLVIFLVCAVVLGGYALFDRDRALAGAIVPPEDEGYAPALAAYAGFMLTDDQPGEEGNIPLDLMETFAWKEYRVKQGDTLSGIAKEFSLSLDAIVASNSSRIERAKQLPAGRVLRIPNMDGIPYTVKRGDTLASISSAHGGVPVEAILDANDLQSETIAPGATLFIPGAKMKQEDLRRVLGDILIYPLRGRLTSNFGWRNDPISRVRRHHSGIDLAAPIGTTIKAAMDGRISTVGNNATYGKFVIMTHSGGYQTMYAHMSRITVREGAYIYQGAKIGEVGSTGYSTGPHLHFAVYKNKRAINPLELLNN